MENDKQQSLNIGFDELLFQLSKGLTIEQYEKGMRWFGLEKVKEWKSRFGYQFHIYSNDHLIDNKPHFHLLKESDGSTLNPVAISGTGKYNQSSNGGGKDVIFGRSSTTSGNKWLSFFVNLANEFGEKTVKKMVINK